MEPGGTGVKVEGERCVGSRAGQWLADRHGRSRGRSRGGAREAAAAAVEELADCVLVAARVACTYVPSSISRAILGRMMRMVGVMMMMMGHGVVLCVMMMAMLIGSKRGGELVASIGEVLKSLVSYLLCRVVEKEEGRRFGGCLSGWPCPILMNVRGLCCETLLHVSSTCPPRVLHVSSTCPLRPLRSRQHGRPFPGQGLQTASFIQADFKGSPFHTHVAAGSQTPLLLR